jgi:ribonuclease E
MSAAPDMERPSEIEPQERLVSVEPYSVVPSAAESAAPPAISNLEPEGAGHAATGDEPEAEEVVADRTAAILAAADGNWIEAMAPFVPVENVPSPASIGSAFEQSRRRRRRGGRRGGRGRRPGGGSQERLEDSAAPPSDPASSGAPADAGGFAAPAGEARSASRRRRRRGGSGRRRSIHEGRSSTDGAEASPTAAVTAPAEPPAES